MATVEVSFTPLPAHVRTARLVATAVARRGGVPESLLDEVRLAVGEACSRAVEEHRRHCPSEPVRIRLTREDDRFEVTVSDCVPAPISAGAANGTSPGSESAASLGQPGGVSLEASPDDGLLEEEAWSSGVGMAVIAGLADDVQITRSSGGLTIAMSWQTK